MAAFVSEPKIPTQYQKSLVIDTDKDVSGLNRISTEKLRYYKKG
jgi:hypothetical protein